MLPRSSVGSLLILSQIGEVVAKQQEKNPDLTRIFTKKIVHFEKKLLEIFKCLICVFTIFQVQVRSRATGVVQ